MDQQQRPNARFRLSGGLLIAGLAAAAFAAHAQGLLLPPPPSAAPASEAKGPPADPFEQVLAAKTVADYGRRQHDPLALLTAARMLKEVPFQDAAPEGEASSDAPAAFTVEGLLAEARAMAGNDEALLAQLTLPKTHRGVLISPFGKGLVRTLHQVDARSTYGFAVQAKPGELLRVGAIGDARTQMVIKVSDPSGRVLCADDNRDYAPVCSTTPQSTTTVHVEIANRSDYPTRAVILSN